MLAQPGSTVGPICAYCAVLIRERLVYIAVSKVQVRSLHAALTHARATLPGHSLGLVAEGGAPIGVSAITAVEGTWCCEYHANPPAPLGGHAGGRSLPG